MPLALLSGAMAGTATNTTKLVVEPEITTFSPGGTATSKTKFTVK